MAFFYAQMIQYKGIYMHTNIKNIVVAGYVISKYDNEETFISGNKLIKLYGLNPLETYIIDTRKKEDQLKYENLKRNKNLKFFYPRYDGKYKEQ